MSPSRYYEPAQSLTEIAVLDQLTTIRRARGLTGIDVANAMGCSQSAIAMLESSARRGHSITLERLLRYADAIGAELHIETREASR